MTRHPRHIHQPFAVLDGDAGLRRVQAFRRLAERGLIEGDADVRALAAKILWCLDRGDARGFMAVLGLGGPGWTGALTRYRQERRNEALRGIRRDAYADVSTANAARLIAARWRLVEARMARRASAPLACPDATLWRLLEAGHGTLAASTIRGILGGGGDDLHGVETINRTEDV